MRREVRTPFDAVNPGMPAAVEISRLPRLSDAERDSLGDDCSVIPAAVDDEQLVRRDPSTLDGIYVRVFSDSIGVETSANDLIGIIEQHRHYRELWMESATESRGFRTCEHFIRKAKACSRVVVLAKRRLRALEVRS